MKRENLKLSVIIPAYNESKRIGQTLREADNFLSSQNYQYEIIVVDDGSTDDTTSVVKSYIKYIKNLELLNGEPNRGKGYAVLRGMRHAKGDYKLFMDADGSTHISEVAGFLEHAERGYDVVIGSISHPDISEPVIEHNGWHRRFLGSLSKYVVRKFVVPGIYDTQRGFKLFSRRAAEIVFPRQTIHRFGFDMELLVIALDHNLKIKEVPVAWNNPAGSTVKASDYLKTFRELFEIVGNKLANAYV